MAKQKITRKKVIVTVVILVLIGATVAALEKTGKINLYKSDQSTTTENEQSTSEAETAQSDFTGADQREVGNTLDENKGSAVIKDGNGTITSNTDTSNPIMSKSGEISLYSPKKDAILSNNFEISGASSLTKVTYRVIDSVNGVISMGELSVNNGKFSGNLNIETSAQDGRIDFYATRSDGTEYSNVEVPVRFK